MRIITVAVILSALTSGCVFVSRTPPPAVPQTQLQIREYQTREFDTNDVKLVMKAVLNVLQDEGFVVRNAVPDLGLLTASKEYQVASTSSAGRSSGSDTWADIFEAIFSSRTGGRSSRRSSSDSPIRVQTFKQIEASVNVSELGSRCKVRANFIARILDGNGQPLEVYAVDDMKFYQDFFVKVDKGVFIQKQGF